MTDPLPPDPYKILGVPRDAGLPEIRSAHRKLVLKCHPDKVQDPALKLVRHDEFQSVQQAYELLSDDNKRARYDDQYKLLELRREMGRGNPPPLGKADFRKKISQGIEVIHGRINGFDHYAIPDTGAEFNIMARNFARSRGLFIDNDNPSKSRPLRMANGKHIMTVGIVEVTWCFSSDDSQPLKIIFHVLKDFVYDLILGSQFLFLTKTMSHHKERLSRIPRQLNALFVMRVNVLGSASRQVKGTLQGDTVKALPDSGSEPSLLSYDYVKRRGWLMQMNMEDQNLLQFADGSVEKTEGSISATWLFPYNNKMRYSKRSLEVQFHILRGCSHDIILGQDVLEECDMFLEHENAFLDVRSDTEASGLNLVIWLPKKKKASTTSPPPRRPDTPDYGRSTPLSYSGSSRTRRPPISEDSGTLSTEQPDPLHVELQRRARVDRRINRMAPGTKKDSAVAEEQETRRSYDAHTSTSSQPRSSIDSNRQAREKGDYYPHSAYVDQEPQSKRRFSTSSNHTKPGRSDASSSSSRENPGKTYHPNRWEAYNPNGRASPPSPPSPPRSSTSSNSSDTQHRSASSSSGSTKTEASSVSSLQSADAQSRLRWTSRDTRPRPRPEIARELPSPLRQSGSPTRPLWERIALRKNLKDREAV